MKNLRKLFFVLLFAVVLLTACGKKDEPTNNTNTDNDKYLSISTTELVVPKGETKTFDIVIKNAVGKFDITTGDNSIATVDKDSIWLEAIEEESDTKTITISGVEVGNTEITVNLSDVAAFDTEKELTGSYKINVKVE